MRKAKNIQSSSIKQSYTKSSKKWTHFGWFMLGVILLAGIGYATTVSDQGLSLSPKINQVIYVDVNDGSDIQEKIDSATDGDIIKLPEGNYTVTASITLNKKIIFEGYGENSTIYGLGDFSVFIVNNTAQLRNFRIIMQNPTTNQKDTLRFEDSADDSLAEDLVLINPTRTGIFMTNNPDRLRINRVRVYNAGIGTDEGRGFWGGSAGGVISNSYSINSTRYGYELQNTYAMTVINSVSDGARRSDDSSGRGYHLVNCISCSIVGGWVNSSALTGILFNNANYSRATGVTIYNTNGLVSETRAIESQDSYFVSIYDNYIRFSKNSTGQGVGILVQANNNSVRNNIIENTQIGIRQDIGYTGLDLGTNYFINTTTKITMNRQSYFGLSCDRDTRFCGLGKYDANYSLDIENEPSPYIRLSDDGGNSANAGGILFKEDRASSSSQYEFRIRHDGSGNNLIIEDSSGGQLITINRFSGGITIGNTTRSLNLTMTSPNNTQYKCGVNNSGSFICA